LDDDATLIWVLWGYEEVGCIMSLNDILTGEVFADPRD
jgi:hypothetical protein